MGYDAFTFYENRAKRSEAIPVIVDTFKPAPSRVSYCANPNCYSPSSGRLEGQVLSEEEFARYMRKIRSVFN